MQIQSVRMKNKTWLSPLPTSLDSENTLILCFARPGFFAQPQLKSLKSQFPKSQVVGCSTAGNIAGDAIEDDVVVATFCQFEATQVVCRDFSVGAGGASVATGLAIASEFGRIPDVKHIFILSEDLKINGASLVRTVADELKRLGSTASVSGGMAGTGPDFGLSETVFQDTIAAQRVVAVALAGAQLQVTSAAGAGWDRFGPQRMITKSQGNLLLEIDGRPALDLYSEYLGPELTKSLPGSAILFPLAVEIDGMPDVIRSVLGMDFQTKAMAFAAEVPEGAKAFIMKCSFEKLITAAKIAAQEALRGQPQDKPLLAVVVSCVGRRIVLGEKCEDELEIVRSILPKHSTMCGFYSNGEVSALPHQGVQYHNETFSLTLLSEKLP